MMVSYKVILLLAVLVYLDSVVHNKSKNNDSKIVSVYKERVIS